MPQVLGAMLVEAKPGMRVVNIHSTTATGIVVRISTSHGLDTLGILWDGEHLVTTTKDEGWWNTFRVVDA